MPPPHHKHQEQASTRNRQAPNSDPNTGLLGISAGMVTEPQPPARAPTVTAPEDRIAPLTALCPARQAWEVTYTLRTHCIEENMESSYCSFPVSTRLSKRLSLTPPAPKPACDGQSFPERTETWGRVDAFNDGLPYYLWLLHPHSSHLPKATAVFIPSTFPPAAMPSPATKVPWSRRLLRGLLLSHSKSNS